MEGTINIDGKDVKFKSTAATPILYKQLIGKDMLMDVQALQKPDGSLDSSIFYDIAYTMAKHADPSIPDTLFEWCDSFSRIFSLYEAAEQIMKIWGLGQNTTAEIKKKV